MNCPDCERIDHLLHDVTTIWLAMPSAEGWRRVRKLCRDLSWPAAVVDGHGLRVDMTRAEVDRFVTALYGELKGPELAGMRVVTTEGREPGPADLGRVMGGDVFVNRFKAGWIVDALEAERYTTWFQPIVHATDPDPTRPFAREGLFRLRDRDGTQIPPSHVFAVASDAGLLFSLDLIARRSAVEAAARAQVKSKLFINFNPSSIYDPSYCLRTTAAAIEELGFRPSDVVFELTETHRRTTRRI